MRKEIEIRLSPEEAQNTQDYDRHIARALNQKLADIKVFNLLRRSVDARKASIKIQLLFEVFLFEKPLETEKIETTFRTKPKATRILVIGAGPAGLYAALGLLEKGFQPIVIERGKNVSERKVDIALLNKNHLVNADSKYCFGE